MEFKDKLRKLRSEKNVSQQTLADAIFISRSAVAKWENGLGLPNGDSMTALCNYFGVAADYFSTEQAENIIIDKNKKIRRLRQWFIIAAALIVMYAAIFIYYTIPSRTDESEDIIYDEAYEFAETKISLRIFENGTFFYNDGKSIVGFGYWSKKDDVLTLTGTTEALEIRQSSIGRNEISFFGIDGEETFFVTVTDGAITVNGHTVTPDVTNRFRLYGKYMYFIEDGSDNFIALKLKENDMFFCSGDGVIF